MLQLARSLGLAALLSAFAASAASATTLGSIGSFDQPIFVTSDPADSSRIFVVERPGRVAEVSDEGRRAYADLTALVACCASERGLLSIAPAPDFHESGLFYAAYTGTPAAGGAEGDIHVDALLADAEAKVTRTPILSIEHSQLPQHNGGQLQFGPDGHLYISTGDGGGTRDPFATAQDVTSLLGKILRIAPDPTSGGYSIPPGNPFASGPGADEIWAFGLRNPWRLSFDSLNGDMLIGEVGQAAREEVDLARSPSPGVVGGAGVNYGWSCREGSIAQAAPAPNCAAASGFTDPIFDYPHIEPPGADRAFGCAITGGYIVRDPSLADLYGRYLYADYCTSEIRALTLPGAGGPAVDRSAGIATPTPNPVSFGEDSCHRLYVAAGSRVYHLKGIAPAPCPDPPEEAVPPPGGDGPKGDREIPNHFEPGPPPVSVPPSVGLEADDLGDGSYRLRVQVSACAPSDADSIQLNRGGRRLATMPANRGCAARFHIKLERPATFRAIFRSMPDAPPVRSKRVAL